MLITTIFRACHHQTFNCPVGVWVIEQHAIILSATVCSSYCACGDFERGGHQLRLGIPGLPRKYHDWCTMKENPNYKLITLLKIIQFLLLQFYIPITFSSENDEAVMMQIA